MGRPKKDELKREIRERNGTFYAYTSTSEIVNGRKITKTTYEGIWDPVTKTVKPKKPRGKYRSKTEIAEVRREMSIRELVDGLETKEYGSVHLLDRIQHRSRLGRDLWAAFGEASRGILGTAMALCVHRGSFMDIEDTLDRSMIREVYGLKGSYSSQEMSEFTHNIGLSTDNMDTFFGLRIRACNDVVSWDSTTIGTWAKDNGYADYVKNNKDDEDIPQVKKAFASNEKGVPVMFEMYPGTMSDTATMRCFVDRVLRYGPKDLVFVMDRGYESGSNIRYLESLGVRYVFPAKIMDKAIKSLLSDFRKPLMKPRIFNGHAYDVWETRLGLVEGDGRQADGSRPWHFVRIGDEDGPDTDPHRPDIEVKAFVCFDTKKRSDEIQSFRLMIDGIYERLKDVDDPDPMGRFRCIAGKAARYFDAKPDGRKLEFKTRKNALSFRENRAGTFIMLTSRDMSWDTMMSSYDARRLVEQNFDMDKTLFGRFGTSDPVTIAGREFVRFVALIMRCEIASMLREHGRGDSVDGVLNSMAAIAAMGKGDEWFVKNICKKHRDLLLDIGMDIPEEVRTSQSICTPEELGELGENLPM